MRNIVLAVYDRDDRHTDDIFRGQFLLELSALCLAELLVTACLQPKLRE